MEYVKVMFIYFPYYAAAQRMADLPSTCLQIILWWLALWSNRIYIYICHYIQNASSAQ